MLPNKILLFPLLGKLAFTGNKNINILGLEAQSTSIVNEHSASFSTSFLPSWRHSNQISKSHGSVSSWGVLKLPEHQIW
jgi:hypothetical protein